ncbi:hypothetical protein MGA3_11770 [Bacillus methanolicus MGA3]|nr:hypothetical protein MGA3_11770 [Bacillus methanolicus MGA3]
MKGVFLTGDLSLSLGQFLSVPDLFFILMVLIFRNYANEQIGNLHLFLLLE